MKLVNVSLLTLLGLGACTPARPPSLAPQVQYGPAASVKPSRVLVLQATCGSVEAPCPKEYRDTVDAIVRSGLEFAGYSVVDSDTLRLATRSRTEEHTSTTTSSSSTSQREIVRPLIVLDSSATTDVASQSTTDTTYVVLDGSNFDDLSVDERHLVIEKSGADGLASVRIVIGGKVGVWVPNQNVEVMIKLGVNRGDDMAWASRCTASSNDFTTVTAALENAARCAVHGATAR
jgi:hypothetical protein